LLQFPFQIGIGSLTLWPASLTPQSSCLLFPLPSQMGL
jgi:hypothetical protein